MRTAILAHNSTIIRNADGNVAAMELLRIDILENGDWPAPINVVRIPRRLITRQWPAGPFGLYPKATRHRGF